MINLLKPIIFQYGNAQDVHSKIPKENHIAPFAISVIMNQNHHAKNTLITNPTTTKREPQNQEVSLINHKMMSY